MVITCLITVEGEHRNITVPFKDVQIEIQITFHLEIPFINWNVIILLFPEFLYILFIYLFNLSAVLR